MVPTSQKISFYYLESKMKDFVEKDVSNRPKKAITGRSLWKMKKKKKKKKKIVPTSQKISCLLARISCFSENCFFLIPITFSTSSKIALTKKTLFPLGRNSFSNSWIKDFEKSVTTIWKSCFYFKKSLKKMVFNGSSSKIDFYLISIKVSTSRKNLRIKQYRFQ